MGRKFKILGSLVVILLAYYWARPGPQIGKIVEVKSGKLQGIISKSRNGRDFYEWLGIPYAQAPTGKLRYSSPKPVERWEGVRDAHKYGSKCAQLEMLTHRFLGDEDCLYLNVHVPKITKTDNLPQGLPVMLYIHGGAFNFMSSGDYRPEYFMDEDVILVVINYRLGSFGFLYTGDQAIRGNMGLKDQALALKWVSENIRSFGGDPKKITIFGESAGGASVHYLMLSSKTNNGLFSKAISQSGVATNPWGIDPPEVAKESTLRFAASVGCNITDDSTRLVDCLRGVSTSALLGASVTGMRDNEISKPHLTGHFMRPTIEAVDDEEAFITEHPLKLVAKGKASQVPWMAGVTADEGLISTIEFVRRENSMKEYEADWNGGISRAFGIPRDHNRLPELADKIRKFYFPEAANFTKQEKLDQYTKMFSDAFFNLHLSNIVSHQRQFSNIHLYRYNTPTGISLATILAEIKERFPLYVEIGLLVGRLFMNYYLFGERPKVYGVCHGDDLSVLWLMPGIFTVHKNEDDPNLRDLYHFSQDIVKLWVDFAKNENELSFRGQSWQKIEREGPLTYLDIRAEPEIISDPFKDRVKFLQTLDILQCS